MIRLKNFLESVFNQDIDSSIANSLMGQYIQFPGEDPDFPIMKIDGKASITRGGINVGGDVQIAPAPHIRNLKKFHKEFREIDSVSADAITADNRALDTFRNMSAKNYIFIRPYKRDISLTDIHLNAEGDVAIGYSPYTSRDANINISHSDICSPMVKLWGAVGFKDVFVDGSINIGCNADKADVSPMLQPLIECTRDVMVKFHEASTARDPKPWKECALADVFAGYMGFKRGGSIVGPDVDTTRQILVDDETVTCKVPGIHKVMGLRNPVDIHMNIAGNNRLSKLNMTIDISKGGTMSVYMN